MNSKSHSRSSTLHPRPFIRAFTLIELLVVIAVIAILAGLLFTAMPGINRAKTKSLANAELKEIATAIEAYKAKYGTYPQDNTNNTALNPLYFELTGMLISGGNYKSLDGGYSVAQTTVQNACKIGGLVNASDTPNGSDERAPAISFLKDLKPDRLATNAGVRILIFSQDGTPWNYKSTNPTNNAGSYDLWIDVVLGDKTNRISNWAK